MQGRTRSLVGLALIALVVPLALRLATRGAAPEALPPVAGAASRADDPSSVPVGPPEVGRVAAPSSPSASREGSAGEDLEPPATTLEAVVAARVEAPRLVVEVIVAGRPAAGALVRLHGPGAGERSGPDGTARLPLPRHDGVEVEVELPGWAIYRERVGQLQLLRDPLGARVRIELRGAGRVVARVLDAFGSPVADHIVDLYAPPAEGLRGITSQRVASDAQGYAYFEGVPAGAPLGIRCPAWRGYSRTAQELLELDPGAIQAVDLVVVEGPTERRMRFEVELPGPLAFDPLSVCESYRFLVDGGRGGTGNRYALYSMVNGSTTRVVGYHRSSPGEVRLCLEAWDGSRQSQWLEVPGRGDLGLLTFTWDESD